MPSRSRWPAVLTIAGSDTSGGAGVQADLKVFASLGVHGLSAITCLTAQTLDEVIATSPVSSHFLDRQIETVSRGFQIRAVKIGLIHSRGNVETVSDFVQSNPRIKTIFDPVMIASNGEPLVNKNAIKPLLKNLLPLVTLVTPNLNETAYIVGHPIDSIDDMRDAAKQIYDDYGCSVLVKGGHLDSGHLSVDILHQAKAVTQLEAKRSKSRALHGTGCTYSAAIAAHIAKGLRLLPAVELSKHYITQAIHNYIRVDRLRALNPLWNKV